MYVKFEGIVEFKLEIKRGVIELNKNVYRKLAQKLDAIPNGFAETESGIELKLLAKIYTLEEAALASQMKLTPENAEQISQRTKQEAAVTKTMLEDMAEKGLIRSVGKGEERKFGLMPFIVGIYEAQIDRMDEELACLFEEYYESFAEKVLSQSPALHKIIPVEKSIPVEVQVFPFEQASILLDKAKSFGVLKCICKVQKSLIGKPCKYPEEVCLVFSSAEDSFNDDTTIRTLTKEEALQILRETEEAGLIHSSTNIQEGHFYICNCCPCCCGIIRGLSQFGVENSVAKSDYYAVVDPDTCIGCRVCLDRCHFGAPSLQDDVSIVDKKRCVGCGLCVITCPSGAIKLVKKPEKEITSTPRNRGEWMKQRATNRGISLQEVL